ncbi:MAG: toprim domain-containing protein [Candidatus Methanomethylicaceae archaeon]
MRSTLYLTTGSEEIRFNCPRCGDSKYHLYFNPRKRLFNCFRCGYSGRGFPKDVNVYIVPPTPKASEARTPRLINWEPLAPQPRSIFEEVILDYLLHTRSLSLDIIREYRLGWSSDLPFAVVIPIYMNNSLVALQVRHLTQTKAKYLFYPVDETPLKKKVLLFNYDRVKHLDTVFVMEGIFDVLCADPQRAVCTFGKQISADQSKLLATFAKTVILAYDPDVKLGELQKSVDRLESYGIQVYIKRLPNGKDPADLGSSFHSLPESRFDYFVAQLII